MNYKKQLFLFIVSALTLFSGCTNLHGEKEDVSLFTDTVPRNYLEILGLNDSSLKTSKEVAFHQTVTNLYRKPVSSFYISKKYYLQIYMMDSLYKYSLKKAIQESYDDALTYFDTPYITDEFTDMCFMYKHTRPKIPQRIFLDINGDSTRVELKNDSVACYYSKCSNFWIKFNRKDFNDIYGRLKDNGAVSIPLEIMFLKEENKLYLLLLSSISNTTPLKANTLINITRRKYAAHI